MKIGYYPGCTLKVKAKNLEDSAVQSLKALGVELVELERWNCCGAVHNLADDDLVHFLAPVRDLWPEILEAGIPMYVCGACVKTYHIREEDLVPGVKIVQLPSLASEMMERETITF